MKRFLKWVEKLGNILPHPITLFIVLTALLVVASWFFDFFDISVLDPRPEGAKGRALNGMIEPKSLITREGLIYMVTSAVKNFTAFAPLGTVLVAMLGVGVAESSGFLKAMMTRLVLKAPKKYITFFVVFAGIISNTASEMGYVVLVPLAGYIFLSFGRHPLAGMAAAFAGVSGGYSANLFIGTLDPLLAGITQEAARLIAPEYTVHAAINWYFMMGSTFVVAILGTLITDKIVEPTLGVYDPSLGEKGLKEQAHITQLTNKEKKGLNWALITLFSLIGILLLTVIPENGILRHPETGDALKSPFMKSMVTWILITFLIPSIVYGKITGTIKKDTDIIAGMDSAMARLSLYIVLVFFAAQFVAYFNWTNLGAITAVSGANLLKALGLTGSAIFFPFILVCGFVNLMLGSASAQWAVTAPIFVPMLMLLGYSPEVIQASYRIGDSTTNIITPMMSYFGLIIAFADKFKRGIGVGTVVAMMLPYSIIFIIGWSIFFYLWTFVFNLPVGPGSPTFFTP